MKVLFALFLSLFFCLGLGALPHHQIHHFLNPKGGDGEVCGYYGPDSTEICAQEKFYNQQLDHFRFDNDATR